MTTHEKQDRPDPDEVFARAVDAAWAALGKPKSPTKAEIAEALNAASDVQAAADQAYADKLVAETGMAGMSIEDGSVRISLVLAHQLAAKMCLSFKTILDAQPNAFNYVEQEIIDRTDGGRYVFAVCKPGGKTPHQLRQVAEVERDALRYERRLLGFARRTLDLVAAGGPESWNQARREAEDIAQRIVDEIGHPVTDEDVLGPSYREEIARLRAEVDKHREQVNRAGAVLNARQTWHEQLDEEDPAAEFYDAISRALNPEVDGV